MTKSGPAPLFAFLGYSVIALVLTWPLAADLGSDVPGDLGDSCAKHAIHKLCSRVTAILFCEFHCFVDDHLYWRGLLYANLPEGNAQKG